MRFDNSITNNFAELLRLFYLKIELKEPNKAKNYDKELSSKFKLGEQFDHYVIESCQYILEDTEMAISNFERFGLDGPTKYANCDESYLRLYGFLNAVYLQKSVPIQLMEIFKIPQKRQMLKVLNELKIIDIRNKVASHTLDYKLEGKWDYFRIAQITVNGFGENLSISGKGKSEVFNLLEELITFKKVFHSQLSKIFEKIFEKYLIKGSKKRIELDSYLNAINHQIRGDSVILGNNGFVIFSSDQENE